MGRLQPIKSDKADCGITAIKMICNAYDIDYEMYIDILYGNGITYFGELLNTDQVDKALSIFKMLQVERKDFKNVEELKDIFESSVKDARYILFPYYALQGFVVINNKVDMKHVHWGVFYDIKENNVYGKQSNIKAEIMRRLYGIDINKLYMSNESLDRIKIDFGKYHKCDIEISKSKLGIQARCGENKICSQCTDMSSNECIYNCNLAGTLWVISKESEG